MSELLHIDAGDEIADLIESVKRAPGDELALVLPARARAFQTPLNVRLLNQYAKTSGKSISIVSEDARIQTLARTNGFTTFASVTALERGIETTRPASTPATSAVAADSGVADLADTAVAPAVVGAVAVAPKPDTEELSSAWTQRGTPPRVPATRTAAGAGGSKDRRPLYFAGVAVAVIGLLLFLFVAPSATVTVTLTATPHSVNPVIQGTTDAAASKGADHILTQVQSDTETAQFSVAPTGTKQLPAIASSGSIVIQSRVPGPELKTTIPKNEEFDTADGHKFYVIQDTAVDLQPPGSGADYGSPSAPVPVQSLDTGNAANVAANTITVWPDNPCDNPSSGLPSCTGHGSHPDLKVTNPAATTGGTDAKTVNVASAGDVTSWQAKVAQFNKDLTTKTDQAISTKTNGKIPAKDPNGGGDTTACTLAPALPAANDQFATTQFTVTCTQTAATYSVDDVKAALMSDLQAQVAQGEVLASDQCNLTLPPQVTQAGTDGTVIISAKGSCFSHPAIDLEAMKSQFTGKSPSDVTRLITGRAGSTATVAIKETPFSLPILPFFASRITVVLVYASGS